MKLFDRILIVSSVECMDSARCVRAILEGIYLHVEFVVIHERKQFEAFCSGKYSCDQCLIVCCHGTSKGLQFPLMNLQDEKKWEKEGKWERKNYYLEPGTMKRLVTPSGQSVAIALACACDKQEHAKIFSNAGFDYYIGHNWNLLEDSKILYITTFFCALRAEDRQEQERIYSIEEAHQLASRAQEFDHGTRGFKIFKLQQGVRKSFALHH